MKKFFIIAAMALFAVGCGTKGYTVEGNVEGLEGTVKIMDGTETIAETEATGGQFTFTGTLEKPAVYNLMADTRRIGVLFLENGAKIKITGKVDGNNTEIVVEGTPAHEAMRTYNAWEKELFDRYRDASAEDRDGIMEERTQRIATTIDENMGNLYGVYLLRSNGHSMDPSEMVAKLDKFPAQYQDVEMLVNMRSVAEAKILTSVGKQYVDFSLPDPEGNEVALSSVIGEGKYVLLDFWASWCGPCMRELPFLLKDYKDYHAKGFEIFGVSLDREKDKWVACINDNNMNWPNVSAVKYWDCPAAKLYGVNSIPTNLLIGPDGTIIAKNLRGEDLGAKLAELLK